MIGVGMIMFDKPDMKEGDRPDWANKAAEKTLADRGVSCEDIEQVYVGYCYGDSSPGQCALYGPALTGIPVANVNNNWLDRSSAPIDKGWGDARIGRIYAATNEITKQLIGRTMGL